MIRLLPKRWHLSVLTVTFMLFVIVLGGIGGIPRPNPSQAFSSDQQTESGGNASTGMAWPIKGQPLDSPPEPSPELLNRVREARFGQGHQDPPTPVDPNTQLRFGPPSVPESTPPSKAPVIYDWPSVEPATPEAVSFQFYQINDLGSGTGSIIPEPSVASNGIVILETWNWYAGISNNGGVSWKYYNPATLFPTGYGGFCCDQSAYYDQNHDITIWILQYQPIGSGPLAGNNAIRLAWSKGQLPLMNANFCYTDFTPQQVGSPNGTNYDQPKFARSNNDYYLSIMRYGTASGAVVLRFPTSALTWPTCGGVSYSFYFPGLFSPGFTQRAQNTMYFAAHVSTSDLRVFSWPESVDWPGITSVDVANTAYPENFPYRCPRIGGSTTSDWCQRRSFTGGWAHSDRIFTGWLAGGVITFVWDASQGTGGFGTFNYPYLQFIRINESTKARLSEPIVWSANFAWQYASAALDDRLDVAGTFMWGGGQYFENCGAFIWDSDSPGWGGTGTFGWEDYAAVYSNADPNDTLSGDYLASRRNGFNGNSWNGTCYALVNGGANANVHVYNLWFGRNVDFRGIPILRLPILFKG